MSVTIRPYRRGGWEVDIRVVAPDGSREFRGAQTRSGVGTIGRRAVG
jgi:hypothetical protein